MKGNDSLKPDGKTSGELGGDAMCLPCMNEWMNDETSPRQRVHLVATNPPHRVICKKQKQKSLNSCHIFTISFGRFLSLSLFFNGRRKRRPRRPGVNPSNPAEGERVTKQGSEAGRARRLTARRKEKVSEVKSKEEADVQAADSEWHLVFVFFFPSAAVQTCGPSQPPASSWHQPAWDAPRGWQANWIEKKNISHLILFISGRLSGASSLGTMWCHWFVLSHCIIWKGRFVQTAYAEFDTRNEKRAKLDLLVRKTRVCSNEGPGETANQAGHVAMKLMNHQRRTRIPFLFLFSHFMRKEEEDKKKRMCCGCCETKTMNFDS